MGPRKPPGVSFETWVDRQVREAAERGAFDGLSAAGKPLDDARLAQGAEGWVFEWARREGADMTAALPVALALRIEREQLVERIPGLASERAVTIAVEDFNERLDAAYRRPQQDPPLALPFLDLERHLRRWRGAAQERAQAAVAGSAGGEVPTSTVAGGAVDRSTAGLRGRLRRWAGDRWRSRARRRRTGP